MNDKYYRIKAPVGISSATGATNTQLMYIRTNQRKTPEAEDEFFDYSPEPAALTSTGAITERFDDFSMNIKYPSVVMAVDVRTTKSPGQFSTRESPGPARSSGSMGRNTFANLQLGSLRLPNAMASHSATPATRSTHSLWSISPPQAVADLGRHLISAGGHRPPQAGHGHLLDSQRYGDARLF